MGRDLWTYIPSQSDILNKCNYETTDINTGNSVSATLFDFNIEPIFPPKALRWAAVSLAVRQEKKGGEGICLSGKGNPSGTLRLGRVMDQGIKKK